MRRVLDYEAGVYGLKDDYLALLSGLDQVVLEWARELGAEGRRYPTLISTDTLLRTDYYSTFPSQATFSAPASPSVHAELKAIVGRGELLGKLEQPRMQLRPALCYHVYEELSQTALDSELVSFTVFGSCFRHEERPRPLERQREFAMREIVFAGEPGRIAALRTQLCAQSIALGEELGLRLGSEVAADPFFGSANRGRQLYQKAKQLKWELVHPMSSGSELALASFNLHEEYFGEAFEIYADASRQTFASTGCNGWGFDRWIAAIVDVHGESPAGWPEAARKLVERGS